VAQAKQGAEKKGRSRSVTRHHRHSSKHSNKRAHSSSSPYPTRNHRRYGVDELKGQMNKINPPTFDREHKKYEDMATRHEEIFPIVELFFSCRGKNCHLPT
jgi:hypothetical protein